MSSHYHAVVWTDHHEARVIYFNAAAAEGKTVHPAHPTRHLHHRAGSAAGTRERGEAGYYHDVMDALGYAKELLVAGPSTAKTEFVSWLRGYAPPVIERLIWVETLSPMSDGRIVAEARRFFKGADRMRPQTA